VDTAYTVSWRGIRVHQCESVHIGWSTLWQNGLGRRWTATCSQATATDAWMHRPNVTTTCIKLQTHTQLFYSPLSGTTLVPEFIHIISVSIFSRDIHPLTHEPCYGSLSSFRIFVRCGEDNRASAPTIWLDATPSGPSTFDASTSFIPQFYARCPATLPIYPGLGLHTGRLGCNQWLRNIEKDLCTTGPRKN